ncbi:MAG TPA: sulfotransferase, partial [Candidatus Saccharimonadales bacterium]|nr:sulfotransferase [Candidatus Saccharimonadales bacterium]
PNAFRLTRSWVTKLEYLMPERRPTDNMTMGWDLPQEDEFALVNLGVPSPYLTIAFPNERPAAQAYLDLETLPMADRERWKDGLGRFLQSVAYGSRQPLVLKSPPHTARIRALLELFPDARFVHIVRDPHVVFSSTIRLCKALYKHEALQEPTYVGLAEYVYSSFERMYSAFEAQRGLVDPSRIFDLRYEDLVRDPIGRLQALYEELNLGEFERARPRFEAYFADRRDYRTNAYRRDPAVDAEVDRRWGPYMRRYGYSEAAGPSGEAE